MNYRSTQRTLSLRSMHVATQNSTLIPNLSPLRDQFRNKCLIERSADLSTIVLTCSEPSILHFCISTSHTLLIDSMRFYNLMLSGA